MSSTTDPIALFIELGKVLQEYKKDRRVELAMWVEDELINGGGLDMLLAALKGLTVDCKLYSPNTTRALRKTLMETDQQAEELERKNTEDVLSGVLKWREARTIMMAAEAKQDFDNEAYYEYALPTISTEGKYVHLTPDGFAKIMEEHFDEYKRHVIMVARLFGFQLNDFSLTRSPKYDSIVKLDIVISPTPEGLWKHFCASLELTAPKWITVIRRMCKT